MARARKRRRDSTDPLELYRRIRKPMPPPERVIPDKRREAAEREAEREAREGERRAAGPVADVQPKQQDHT